jgi:hypothetical protein
MNNTTSILNQKLSISENALSQQVNGEIVILNFVSESYYTLDAVGTKFWHLFTELENVNTVIQQLVQIYKVDEVALRRDVNSFVEELLEEELLSRENKILENNLVTVDKIKESNKPQQQDNRLPYEVPLLRKHGKVNAATNSNPLPGNFEFATRTFDFTDFS